MKNNTPKHAYDFLRKQKEKTVLRFITCGSVDDGKSTLIGRLLQDQNCLFEDQILDAQNNIAKAGQAENTLDLAHVMDGLAAEREQGITIDVAHKYFSTKTRKFIISDTPGHKQYTRNMVSGASMADLAIMLIDARKGIVEQTKRHSHIVSLLGIKSIIVAVNKMDLMDFSYNTFNSIEEMYHKFSKNLNFENIQYIPISALKGDNVVAASHNMAWYAGPCLLEYLDYADVSSVSAPEDANFRFPVQWVNRPGADFRGYSGSVVCGSVKRGDEVLVMPSGHRSLVRDIVTMDGSLDVAQTGQAVTLVLADELDVSRGDVLCGVRNPAKTSDQFQANIIWMAESPLLAGRDYFLKSACKTLSVTITAIRHKINTQDFSRSAAKTLCCNELGVCNISLNQSIVFDPFKEIPPMGRFVIIDKYTSETVGAGMINFSLRRASNLTWQNLEINKTQRSIQKHQRPIVLWFTGLSGAGKSTIASLVEKKLFDLGRHTYTLDGDNVRHGLNKDLGFTDADRVENIRRIAETAWLMIDAGLIVLVSFISPFKGEREMARQLMGEDSFVEIYINTPLEIVEARDVKGLYVKARRGEIKNFTGIDSEYQEPENADIVVDTSKHDAQQAAMQIIDYLKARGVFER